MGLNTQSLRNQIGFRTGSTGSRKGMILVRQTARARQFNDIERRDNGLKQVYIGTGLRRLDDRRIQSGIVIDAEFDRLLTARIGTGIQAASVCLFVLAVAPGVHDPIHRCARHNGLHLHGPDHQHQCEQK